MPSSRCTRPSTGSWFHSSLGISSRARFVLSYVCPYVRAHSFGVHRRLGGRLYRLLGETPGARVGGAKIGLDARTGDPYVRAQARESLAPRNPLAKLRREFADHPLPLLCQAPALQAELHRCMQYCANDLDLRVQHRRVTIERVNLKQRFAIVQAHAEQPLQPPVNRQLVPLVPRYQLASHRLCGVPNVLSYVCPYVRAHSFGVHRRLGVPTLPPTRGNSRRSGRGCENRGPSLAQTTHTYAREKVRIISGLAKN